MTTSIITANYICSICDRFSQVRPNFLSTHSKCHEEKKSPKVALVPVHRGSQGERKNPTVARAPVRVDGKKAKSTAGRERKSEGEWKVGADPEVTAEVEVEIELVAQPLLRLLRIAGTGMKHYFVILLSLYYYYHCYYVDVGHQSSRGTARKVSNISRRQRSREPSRKFERRCMCLRG
jgi:hypothetical protein